MNNTLINLPTLVNSRDFKNISKLMQKLRESNKPAYLVNNSQIEAIITPVPVFDNSEKAMEEKKKSVLKEREEIEQFWSQNPQLARPNKSSTKAELRKYDY